MTHRCSDRAAAELAARQALREEQEAARQVIEEELAEQARQIAEDYAERRPVYLQIEVQGRLTAVEIDEIIDAVTNLAERNAGPDVAQVAWDVD